MWTEWRGRLSKYGTFCFVQINHIWEILHHHGFMAFDWWCAGAPINAVITKLIFHFASIDDTRKLLLHICITQGACSNYVSWWNDSQRHCKCEVEICGAILMERRGLASPAPCLFPKVIVCTKQGRVICPQWGTNRWAWTLGSARAKGLNRGHYRCPSPSIVDYNVILMYYLFLDVS